VDGPDRSRPPSRTRELTLGTDQYQVASVLIHEGPPAPVRCYALLSFQRSNSFPFSDSSHQFFILGASAVFLGALLLSFVSRTITHPLTILFSGVRALAAGDYTFSITPRGSSEVAGNWERPSRKMRANCWIPTAMDRNRADRRFGQGASSISHDLRQPPGGGVANAEFL